MPRVLGVVGSPRRRGNTDLLVSEILDGAKETGADVSCLYLGEMCVQECDGCHACWNGKPCPQNDDMNAAYLEIMRADSIVLGTPVYWYAPTALMKAFIDRWVFFNCPENREKIRGKNAVLAVVLEEKDPDAAGLLVEFFERCLDYVEMRLLDRIVVPGVTRRGEIAGHTARLAKARALGKRLARISGVG